jgi:hypothetical protein
VFSKPKVKLNGRMTGAPFLTGIAEITGRFARLALNDNP